MISPTTATNPPQKNPLQPDMVPPPAQQPDTSWLAAQGGDLPGLRRLLESAHPRQADFSELYLQRSHSSLYGFEDSILKTITNASSLGCGARVVCGELTGFAYCDSFDTDQTHQALGMAAAIARYAGPQGKPLHVGNASGRSLYPPAEAGLANPAGLDTVLQRVDTAARRLQYVERVDISFASSDEQILVLNSLGVCAADIRPLARAQVRVVLCRNSRRESGSSGSGGRLQLSLDELENRFMQLLNLAYEEALINLDARPCKAGAQTLVLGSGWPGVLLHEAVGHGLEGDFNRKQTSVYSNRLGETVASPLCTVVDNGAMPGRRGSLNMDDEGQPSAENRLIEQGKLCGYMQDRQNAMLMDQRPTGNGRRESYAHLPMPRMTNTYLLPGKHKRDEIIASVEDGIYAVNFNGGQVDITSGNFVFTTSLAYKIHKGKLSYPVKGLSLIGNGPEVMQRVSMVGDDLALDPGIGVCGKDGQSVPVGVGQPTIKIDSIVVGGQN